MMIDAIHQRWMQRPPDRRPKLVLYGESLGSMAGQGAFGWLPDIAQMGFSSVLWVGPPNTSPLWHASTVRRDRAPEVDRATTTGAGALLAAIDGAAIARDTEQSWEAPAAVPAAFVRSDRVVVDGSAVQSPRLARNRQA